MQESASTAAAFGEDWIVEAGKTRHSMFTSSQHEQRSHLQIDICRKSYKKVKILFLFVAEFLYLDCLLQHSRKQLDPDSKHFLTSLVAIGHMTELYPKEFGEAVKTSVSTFVVKDLLMQDKVSAVVSLAQDCFPDFLFNSVCFVCRVKVVARMQSGVPNICYRTRRTQKYVFIFMLFS